LHLAPHQQQRMGNHLVKKRIRLNTVAALASVIGVAAGSAAHAQTGIASVYSGGKTASGEVARAGGMTAAHKTLPFGTLVRVTNRRSGRSIIVRINDRGPFVRGRIIDLMPAAARAIGCSGIAHVTVDIVGRRAGPSFSQAPRPAELGPTASRAEGLPS
jgi:rare lipoprotein A